MSKKTTNSKSINQKKHNVLLISIDALRRDYLGCYNSTKKHSKNIDKFAKENQIYNGMATASNTPSSFPGIFYSKYMSDQNGCYTSKNTPSLVENLSNSGYYTFAFNACNTFISPFFGYGKGFDNFEDYITNKKEIAKPSMINVGIFKLITSKKNYGPFRFVLNIFRDLYRFYSQQIMKRLPFTKAEKLTSDFIDHLDNNVLKSKKAHRPFFAWIHYMDVHYPFVPFLSDEKYKIEKGSWKRNKIMNLDRVNKQTVHDLIDIYHNSISVVDKQIGRIIKTLKEKNLYDNTIILIISDHGEEFLDHNGLDHVAKDYNELLHTPFILKSPFKLKQKHVSLLDLSPTILDFIGSPIPKTMRGIPLTKKKRKYFFSQTAFYKDLRLFDKLEKQFHKYNESVSNLKFKLIHNPDTGYKLFNLKNDPKETKDVSKDNLKEFKQLKNELSKELHSTNQKEKAVLSAAIEGIDI
jgi:arylsulfatase A-like enzyme